MKEYDWNIVTCDPLREPKEGFYVDLVEYTVDGEGSRISDNYLEEHHFTDYATALAYWDSNKQDHYILFNEIEEAILAREEI
jgi:hypothetical protein|tara:strand:- start:190 stop:435 length:246 start_codon:yes stop_codon:yes gene_type:complete